jgi:hypothetical protein
MPYFVTLNIGFVIPNVSTVILSAGFVTLRTDFVILNVGLSSSTSVCHPERSEGSRTPARSRSD